MSAATRTSMTEAAIDEFPTVWLDPSDPDLTWDWDDMHMPFVAHADGRRLRRADRRRVRLRVCAARRADARSATGSGTATPTSRSRWTVPDAERDAVFARRTEASRAAIAVTDAYWRERAIPELRGHYAWVASLPVDADVGRRARRGVGRGVATDGPLLVDPLLGRSAGRTRSSRTSPTCTSRSCPTRRRARRPASSAAPITELHDVERQLERLAAHGRRGAGDP